MTRQKLAIRIVSTGFAVITGVLGVTALWLDSPQGLEWARQKLVRAGNGTIEVENARGSLLGEVQIDRLHIKNEDFLLEAETFTLNWQPWALLRGELHLNRASAATLRYQSLTATASTLPTSLALPLDLSIAALEINRLEISGLPAIEKLRLGYSGGRRTHDIRLLQTESEGWTVDGRLQIATQRPYPIDGQLQAVRGTTAMALQAKATVAGTLQALQLNLTGSGRGASLQATATVRPYDAQALTGFTAKARELDLSAWFTEAPRTRLTLDARAETEQGQLNGRLNLSNAVPGTLDSGKLPMAAASTRFNGNGLRWTLPALELLTSGGGRITGSGALRDSDGSLDIQLRDIDPARLDSRLRPGKISGNAKLSGNNKAQQATARLEGAGLQLQFAARHAGDVVTIDSLRLQAGGGNAEITGQLNMKAAQNFSVRGTLTRLDPSRLAALPQAQLNGRISAEGRLQPDWQAQLAVDLTDSRLRNLPFTANAAFTTQKSRWFDGSAQAAIGRNRLEIKGGYGRAQDLLHWIVAADDLRALDPVWSGRLGGSGTISGNKDGPSLDFKIDGQQLASGAHRINRVDAQGSLAAGREGALRFTAEASGLQFNQTKIDTLRLNSNGTRARHVIDVNVKGADTTGTLRAAGGIDPHGRWVGTLDQLEMGLPWPMRLSAPAQITAGPGLVIVDQLRGSFLDGEFGPVTLRAEKAQITTQGSFRNIAAGRLLPRDSGFADQALRVSGQWALALDDVLRGKASLYRENGDLSLAVEPRLPLDLRKTTINMTAADSLIDLALDIDSGAMGTATARLQTRLVRRDNGWLLPGEAPFTGNVSVDFKSLAWLRGLLPDLDRVDGQVAVRMQASGTVADPRLSGTITGDRIQLRAVGPGLDLRDGRLRATLDGTRFRLDEFELKAGKGRITATGAAELAGGLRSVDLQARAEHAQILLAPQWSAIIDGNGRLGFRDRRITLDGKFSLDEGRYDLGSKRKPELGNDVVVRSAKTEPAAKTASLPVQLDIGIELKDKLTVRGNGLDALLGGSLRITSKGAGLSAIGDVRTVRGNYSVFGQQLEIERGTVAFAGPLTDPGLDLRASRKIQTVEVGVEVTGSLQRPSVKLFSVPDMSDTDRLTWLALGRDPAGNDRAQMAVLQAAVLSLNSSGGKPVQRQIAEGVGLDELGFATGESGTLGVVALGKKLTDQLSIRLEQTLGGTAGSLLRMDFILSESWRLRGTAGAENAGDILFTLRFD
jgi:translocation and assembly module TamB